MHPLTICALLMALAACEPARAPATTAPAASSPATTTPPAATTTRGGVAAAPDGAPAVARPAAAAARLALDVGATDCIAYALALDAASRCTPKPPTVDQRLADAAVELEANLRAVPPGSPGWPALLDGCTQGAAGIDAALVELGCR